MRGAALNGDLQRRIVSILPSLTSKRRRLARVLLDEPYSAAFATAEELGAQAGVDRATVVRFCRVLGYSGFAELRDAIRADMPRFLTATEKLRRRLATETTEPASADSVYAQDIANIESARALCGSDAIESAAAAIAAGDQTVVIAAGMSSPVGWVLAHLLRIIGREARFSESEVTLATSLAQLTPESTVVAIGFWRYVRSTVRLFTYAAKRTASTIAITDSQSSPLARIARIGLLVPTDATELNHSLVAPISVVNALMTRVVLLEPRRTYASLEALDDVYSSADVSSSE